MADKSLDFDVDMQKLEDLLNTLTDEELEKLEEELIDPDDSHIPPSERCRYRMHKKPTGPFNRKALLDFLEKKAKEEKDWEEAKPYVKTTRGKIWKPKEQPKVQINEDADVDTEWDEILQEATEEELVDLAAVLGFHGMLNQIQYHQAFVENKEFGSGGFQGVAKHEGFKKLVPDEPPNPTDVEDSLQKLKDNDAKLTEINLNNIKTMTVDQMVEFGEALKNNTHIEKLLMANTKATDRVAKSIAEGLKSNQSLKVLNLESNYISGESFVKILEAVAEHQVLQEFRVANQRQQVLGSQVEMKIASLMEANTEMLKLGIFLQTADPRVRVQDYLQRNNDSRRQQRIAELLHGMAESRADKA